MEALWVSRCFIPPTDYQMPSWAAMADSHCVADMPDQVVQRAAHLVIITYVHYKIRAGSRHGRTQRDHLHHNQEGLRFRSGHRKIQIHIISRSTCPLLPSQSQLPTQGAREAQGQLPSPRSLQEMQGWRMSNQNHNARATIFQRSSKQSFRRYSSVHSQDPF